MNPTYESNTPFSNPNEPCDVIMKGGISSGVVYPKAIVELAKKYQFKGIGGTSAGAIAAALTAAAEYGRENQGFEKIEKLSEEIPHVLESLFQPTPSSRPIFEFCLLLMDKVNFSIWKLVLWLKYTPLYWILFLALGIGGIIQYAVLPDNTHLVVRVLVMLTYAVIAGLVGFVCHIKSMIKVFLKQLPSDTYGMCTGMGQSGYEQIALTEWLAQKIDWVSGIHESSKCTTKPLTFGDLYGRDYPEDPKKRAIVLELMTTNLSHGRPYKLPLENRKYMFKPDEFKKYFPERIVDWMVKHSKTDSKNPEYYKLPPTQHLPVIVAVRMSLSFPILLSAIPLYTYDYTLLDAEARKCPQKCIFSDGGISSNFPIHFFDAALPTRPTFGITLGVFDDKRHSSRVFFPENSRQGRLLVFTEINTTGQFMGAILNAMQNWQDNLRSIQASYRERIVRINLKEDEGGLNLNMPEGTIENLLDLGMKAGTKINDHFDMKQHQWRRFLVWSNALEGELFALHDTYTTHLLYQDFVKSFGNTVETYTQTNVWMESCEDIYNNLMDNVKNWKGYKPLISDGKIPRPGLDLLLTPLN